MEETKNPTPSDTPAAQSAPASRPAPRPASYDGPRGPRPERNGQQRRGGRFGPRPPKVCPFCSQKVKYIDYKAGDQLRRYLTEKGKIKARRKIGTCAKHQRRLALAIKRARHVALLPFTTESTRGE
jgi:small subunit ribosomal protein S18